MSSEKKQSSGLGRRTTLTAHTVLIGAWFITAMTCISLPWLKVARALAQKLENCYRIEYPTVPVAGIIALGGAQQRVVAAIDIALRFPSARFVMTGAGEEENHRLLALQTELNNRLVIEPDSRTTYENAMLSARMLFPKKHELWILVTSATHMPRAVGAFRRAGFDVHPWPIVHGDDEYRLSLRVAMKEWIGMAFYWLSGRMNAPFPCP